MSRGYCGIGIENAKKEVNLGTLWRSAYCLGASFIFTVGNRYRKQPTDTVCASRHIPYWHFAGWADFASHTPEDCATIGIELTTDAVPLPQFLHPERVVYVLGPEDGSLSEDAQHRCASIVRISSSYCLNVAVAGSIVLYDRQVKRAR